MTKRLLTAACGLFTILSMLMLLAGCADSSKIAPKPKDKDITVDERKAKHGDE